MPVRDKRPRPRADLGPPGRRPAHTAGADRIVSVDLAPDQIQGFGDGPVDHMRAQPPLTGYIKDNYVTEDICVVSPDSGRVGRREMGRLLGGSPLAFIHKTRDPRVPNQVVSNRVVAR